MSLHEAEGETLCIHSVCVDEKHRRKGIALMLLLEYIQRVRLIKQVKRICLLSHEYLLQLYLRAGFTLVGKSEVQHGSETWIECKLDL